jgi:hypothetical protein
MSLFMTPGKVPEPEDQFGPPGEAYREIIREQRKLITELCHALAEFGPYCSDDYETELLQRARDATQ